jgi:hypothetical protein
LTALRESAQSWRELLLDLKRRGLGLQIPAHRGQSFRRIADSIPVIADSF